MGDDEIGAPLGRPASNEFEKVQQIIAVETLGRFVYDHDLGSEHVEGSVNQPLLLAARKGPRGPRRQVLQAVTTKHPRPLPLTGPGAGDLGDGRGGEELEVGFGEHQGNATVSSDLSAT